MTNVLIYGDNMTRGVMVSHNHHVETVDGATTEYLLALEMSGLGLSMLLSEDNYTHVVLVIGTNDVTDLVPRQVIANNITYLVTLIPSNIHVVVCYYLLIYVNCLEIVFSLFDRNDMVNIKLFEIK